MLFTEMKRANFGENEECACTLEGDDTRGFVSLVATAAAYGIRRKWRRGRELWNEGIAERLKDLNKRWMCCSFGKNCC